MNIEELKYPIGKFKVPESYDEHFREEALKTLEELPSHLKNVLKDLPAEKLDAVYRPDSWSLKQVVHHIADSHMNCLVRIKLALTEEHPTIKPYDENKWAALADGNDNDLTPSLLIIEGVHQRIVKLLRSIPVEDFDRKVFHPESKRDMSVHFFIALYAWHAKHHLSHIKNAITHSF